MRRVVAPPATEYRRALVRVSTSLARAERAAAELGLDHDQVDLVQMRNHARGMLAAHNARFPGQPQLPARYGDTIGGC